MLLRGECFFRGAAAGFSGRARLSKLFSSRGLKPSDFHARRRTSRRERSAIKYGFSPALCLNVPASFSIIFPFRSAAFSAAHSPAQCRSSCSFSPGNARHGNQAALFSSARQETYGRTSRLTSKIYVSSRGTANKFSPSSRLPPVNIRLSSTSTSCRSVREMSSARDWPRRCFRGCTRKYSRGKRISDAYIRRITHSL